jgi:hypothetical protein
LPHFSKYKGRQNGLGRLRRVRGKSQELDSLGVTSETAQIDHNILATVIKVILNSAGKTGTWDHVHKMQRHATDNSLPSFLGAKYIKPKATFGNLQYFPLWENLPAEE